LTITVDRRGRLERRSSPDRRHAQAMPPEHDFSAFSLGLSVICVVIVVMCAL
jgi:hypothetical protein